MKLRPSLELNMFPFFVLALSSKGKCEQLCIMRSSSWERRQETESNEAKRDKRRMALAISLLAGSEPPLNPYFSIISCLVEAPISLRQHRRVSEKCLCPWKEVAVSSSLRGNWPPVESLQMVSFVLSA